MLTAQSVFCVPSTFIKVTTNSRISVIDWGEHRAGITLVSGCEVELLHYQLFWEASGRSRFRSCKRPRICVRAFLWMFYSVRQFCRLRNSAIAPFPTLIAVIWGELHLPPRSRGSSVSIVSDYGLDVRAMGMIHGRGKRIFPLVCVSRPAFGVHPASHPMGTGGPFPGGKARPGRGADHLPSSSAEDKDE
jgi:hypothetical protein